MDPREATKCVCERESKSVTAGIKMRLVSDSFNPWLKDSWFDRAETQASSAGRSCAGEERSDSERDRGVKGGRFKKMVHLSPRSSTLNDLDMPG